jgi:PTS system nitrogen regulatory IIA component
LAFALPRGHYGLQATPKQMLLEEIIKPDSVLCNAQARSKKHCLEILGELLARPVPQIANEDIFERLIERERLGCTSLGLGVAFPHCRVAGLDRSIAALIKLSAPVDFDSPDGEPVDLVFGLIVPNDINATDQANIISIADLLSDPELRKKTRAATTSKQLYDALLDSSVAAPVTDLKIAGGS